jgi:hypothetical protein
MIRFDAVVFILFCCLNNIYLCFEFKTLIKMSQRFLPLIAAVLSFIAVFVVLKTFLGTRQQQQQPQQQHQAPSQFDQGKIAAAPAYERSTVYPNRVPPPRFFEGPPFDGSTRFAVGPGYERVGFVYSPKSGARLPLFGRPVIPGGNRFDYYVLDDTIHTNPLGLNEFNGLELVSGDTVSLIGYPGRFTVELY